MTIKLSDIWEKALGALSEEEQDVLLENTSEVLVCELPEKFYMLEGGMTNKLESFFRVEVKRRSKGRYAVIDRAGQAYSSELVAVYESIPSERTESFKDDFRHGFLDAIRLAEHISKNIMTYGPNGPTVSDIIAHGGLPSRA